jgi:hypothetical protein
MNVITFGEPQLLEVMLLQQCISGSWCRFFPGTERRELSSWHNVK